jgi:hypothetical protein
MKYNPVFLMAKVLCFIIMHTMIIHVSAQRISLGPHIEKNIKGSQLGISSSLVFKKHFAVGFYHQHEFNKFPEQVNENYDLSGIIIDFPLYIDTRLNLIGRLKPSLANQRFIMVIPAIETQFLIVEFLQVAGEVSYRAGYPAFAIKTNFLFNL